MTRKLIFLISILFLCSTSSNLYSQSNQVIVRKYNYLYSSTGHLVKRYLETRVEDGTAYRGNQENNIDLQKFTSSIYPNPSSDLIYVQITDSTTTDQQYTWEIYDSVGKKYKIGKSSSSLYSIDIADLPQGYYFLRIFGQDQSEIKYLIKTN
jgi:hypothetical protein